MSVKKLGNPFFDKRVKKWMLDHIEDHFGGGNQINLVSLTQAAATEFKIFHELDKAIPVQVLKMAEDVAEKYIESKLK